MRANLLLVFVFFVTAQAQGQYYSKLFSISADINKPIVNREFISAVSKKGIKINYREFINDRLVLGGEAGMAEYNDYIPPQVYTQDLTSIYTDIYSYVYSYSLAFSGEYFFTTDKIIMPYAGMGIGAAYNQFTMYYNVYTQQDNRWGVLLRPHAGFVLRFGSKSNWGLISDIHVDYANTKSKDTDYDKGFATMGFQIGLVHLKR